MNTTEKIPKELLDSFSPAQFKDSYFITLEGIEGSGKSTHLKTLKEYLDTLGYRVISLREPGGTNFGENLRNAILNSKTKLHPIAEAHLFASARAQLLFEVIIKELAIPKTIVICDRYIDSSFAYQGIARNLGIKTILELHKHYPLNIFPNLTLYIKISLDTSFERQSKRSDSRDYFESETRDFYQKLIDGHDQALELFPKRIVTIDGEESIENVYTQIKNEIDKLIN